MGNNGTCCIQLHEPDLAPSFTKAVLKSGAGPHRELVSGVDGTTAMEEDAAFVLDRQQIRLVFVTRIIDVSAERTEVNITNTDGSI